jgi:hypothetical protein
MQKNKPNEKDREIGLFLLPKIRRGCSFEVTDQTGNEKGCR